MKAVSELIMAIFFKPFLIFAFATVTIAISV